MFSAFFQNRVPSSRPSIASLDGLDRVSSITGYLKKELINLFIIQKGDEWTQPHRCRPENQSLLAPFLLRQALGWRAKLVSPNTRAPML